MPRARLAPRGASRCATAERGSKQLIDLAARLGGGHAVVELDLDQPHEERIERPAGCQELLGDLGKGPVGRDHAGECGDLAAGTLDVPDGGTPSRIARPAHGDTKAAPVIPDAA
jgi:hypothetical protein